MAVMTKSRPFVENVIKFPKIPPNTGQPIEEVEQCDPKHEPPFVNVFRELRCVVDGERLVAHEIDEQRFLPTFVLEPVKHGDAIEQMAGSYHKRHDESLQRMKGREKYFHCHKLHAATVDDCCHDHGPDKQESRYVHQYAVGEAEKPVTCEDRNRIGESSSQ